MKTFTGLRLGTKAPIMLAAIFLLQGNTAFGQPRESNTKNETVEVGIDGVRIGMSCRVIAQSAKSPTQSPAVYEGFVKEITPMEIILTQLSESKNEYGTPVLGQIPFVGKNFKNVSIGREVKTYRIEKLSIQSVGAFKSDPIFVQWTQAAENPGKNPLLGLNALKPGMKCTIKNGSSFGSPLSGKIEQMTDGELVVCEKHEEGQIRCNPFIANIPILNSLCAKKECYGVENYIHISRQTIAMVEINNSEDKTADDEKIAVLSITDWGKIDRKVTKVAMQKSSASK